MHNNFNYDPEPIKVISTGGTSITTILLVVFIVLKLCGVINWAWPIVLIPLWIDLGIFALFLIIFIVMAIISVVDSKW